MDMLKKAEDWLDDLETVGDYATEKIGSTIGQTPVVKAMGQVLANPTRQEVGAQVASLAKSASNTLQESFGGDPVDVALNYGPGTIGTIAKRNIFFRGTNKADTRRIKEPFSNAVGKTFVTPDIEYAKTYGKDIEKIVAKPEAKILNEESAEFWKIIGRKRPPNNYIGSATKKGETLIDLVNYAITKAINSGYDMVNFKGDIGAIILNEDKFIRNLHLAEDFLDQ